MNTQIKKACDILSSGGVVGIPTETVYGLAADATNDRAVARIYELKERPTFNPLILHVSDLKTAMEYVNFSTTAQKMAQYFWHDHLMSLTLVLPKRADTKLSELATAGLDTVAVRVPHHPVAQRLLSEYKVPLVAPSANKSTEISPTTAKDVITSLGPDIFVLDGGPCRVGLESTIIDMTSSKPILLRPGGTPTEDIEEFLGLKLLHGQHGAAIKAPGMMKRHYAPSIPVRLNALDVKKGEALLGFGPTVPKNTALNISPSGNLLEAAANLFSMLRKLDDQKKYSSIAVMPIPLQGLGLAINDRLQRAATQA